MNKIYNIKIFSKKAVFFFLSGIKAVHLQLEIFYITIFN